MENNVNTAGQFLIALNGEIPTVLQCDKYGRLITNNSIATLNSVAKQERTDLVSKVGENYFEHILPSPPIGKAWYLFYIQADVKNGVSCNFYFNNNSLGMYAGNEFTNYSLIEKFGGDGIFVTHNDKLSTFVTNTTDKEQDIYFNYYIKEINV